MARTTTITLADDSVLEVEHDGDWVQSDMPQPDPRWRATDSNGHEHYYAEGSDRYPTLELVFGEPYWCEDCRDEHQDNWYECRQCREKVRPGTRIDSTPKWIAGPTYYSLNGEPIGKERADEILAEAWRRADEAAKISSRPAIGTRVGLDDATVTVVPTADSAPGSEVTVMFDGTGAMETVSLTRLRAVRR
ncbi:hypothetical protein OG352_06605 [Streptomyces sp. NBC_01485]|uniref:hypothetical protein n=1 Tax=Streptomyces sp. NBC_01485 TaxID=2903884 RepID=UPI002E36EF7C|nr:hypothetical protein [Streptomyces sp. NBC_01485]